MRWVLALLLLAYPTTAAELCVQGGEWICCHHLCDLYGPPDPTGFSTEGPYACGSNWGIFTISLSDTDPFQNHGTLTDVPGAPGFSQLYLWLNAGSGYGFSNGRAELGGDLAVASFTPMTEGVAWDPILREVNVWGCAFEPEVIASMLVHLPVSVEPDTWGRIKALYQE